MFININEKKNLEVPDNINILQACSLYNIYIPRFCYHEKLSISGNCRMCLVEVKGVSKPIASCAMPVGKDMQIFTESKLVKKAREGILEFLLINHPLDCPICDQGGECDLQDQSLLYGNDKGRFYDLKRSVKDKDCGPLIKTIMTRCIQCTRCVRFMREIAGLNFLGVVGRGGSMEISNFLQKSLFSEISGNVIDVCPVGALTSKPYSFVARPWELISFNTIDLNDIMHVNIRVDVRDMKILRILPRLNSKLNENWISDATRFSYDGFFLNRLLTPYLNVNKKFVISSWLNILSLFKKKSFDKVNFIVGNFIDAETTAVLKYICNSFGNFSVINLNQKNIQNDFRFNFFFDSTLFNKMDSFDAIFLFNTNLRLENPLLNLKIKKLVDKNIIKIFSFGSSFGYNYLNYNFGNTFFTFLKFIEGKSSINNIFMKFSKVLLLFNWNFLIKFKNSFNFYFLKNNILGFLKHKIYFSFLNYDATFLLSSDFNLLNSINNFNDLSFKRNNIDGKKNIIYSLNAEFFDLLNFDKKKEDKDFFVFQGNFLIKNKKMLDLFNVFLPSSSFIEKNSTFINFFGLIQKTKFILFPFKNVRSDSKIIYILFKIFFKKKFELLSFFNKYNFCAFYFFVPNKMKNAKTIFSINNCLSSFLVTNFYRNNSLLKRSLIMTSCYKNVKNFYSNFI